MLKLQILGTGCAKCQHLGAMTEEAARAVGTPYEIEKVTDLKAIMQAGVMTTPALVVNGVVKVAGRVPSSAELQAFLR